MTLKDVMAVGPIDQFLQHSDGPRLRSPEPKDLGLFDMLGNVYE
jgi:hypothetical protein